MQTALEKKNNDNNNNRNNNNLGPVKSTVIKKNNKGENDIYFKGNIK